MRRSPLAAAGLSLLVPGAGQLYLRRHRRAALLFAACVAIALGAALVAARGTLGPALFATLLAADVALLAVRVASIVDAGRAAAGGAVAALVIVAVVPHVAAAYLAARSYGVLTAVFADDEPGDALAARGLFLTAAAPLRGLPPRDLDPPDERPLRAVRSHEPRPFRGLALPLADAPRILEDDAPLGPPWVTILLLGSDQGPRQAGDRTDTMIVTAIQRQTGRAVLFGVPRNLVRVPLARGGTFEEPLNALYRRAQEHPDRFPDGSATTLKQSISLLLGIRIDYYALVDLDGFVDVVDALGGVTIAVKERLHDEVTRPAWGETKPKIDVYPGRTYHFTGRTTLAYVRSRKDSSDYRRMARQRCVVSAFADQLNVGAVLRHFGALARTVEDNVRTDIPLNRAPDLMRLAAGVDPRQTLTETFGPKYFAGRRFDRWPYPNVAKIRAAVRDAVLSPRDAHDVREIASIPKSC